MCWLSDVERWRSGQPPSRYWSIDALQMNHLQPSPQRNARVRSECRQTALSERLERALGLHLVHLHYSCRPILAPRSPRPRQSAPFMDFCNSSNSTPRNLVISWGTPESAQQSRAYPPRLTRPPEQPLSERTPEVPDPRRYAFVRSRGSRSWGVTHSYICTVPGDRPAAAGSVWLRSRAGNGRAEPRTAAARGPRRQ